jgi:NAD(P)-dependent dehydrogenase (short-subunit alcohol dehydrogenase family)
MPDVALVCGGGGALGEALVRALLDRGDDVVVADLHPKPPRERGVRGEAVDLTAPDEVEALWDRLAAEQIAPRWLVNAAGGFRAGSVGTTGPEDVRLVFDLNLSTAWWSCRAAARRLPAGGAIVNVSSRSAVSGGAGAGGYAVAKAGVLRLTEVLAAELADRRVRVNAILPSVIDTPANRASMSPEAIARAVPPAQVASVAAFLLSDAAAAVSGVGLPVYGWA